LAYVISAGIFVGDYVCTTLKVLENLLFIALEIALLFVYGFSNTMEDINFLDLGYAMIVICVLLVINGAVRFFYYTYCKAYSFYYDVYG
jgi:NADH:ubiquinone oxidoreductase subunit 3 (subunit A)